MCYERTIVRLVIAIVGASAWACNSAPVGSCSPSTGAVVSAAQSPTTCTGTCVDAPDAGTFCLIECTDGGDAVCQAQTQGGTACGPVSITPGRDWCLPTCDVDAGDAGVCPDPRLSCIADAGVCSL